MSLPKPVYLFALGTLTALNFTIADAQNVNSDVTVQTDAKHDVSQPLRNMPLSKTENLFRPSRLLALIKQSDTVQNQLSIGPGSPLKIRAFAGIGVGLGSYMPTASQPDLINAVGTSQTLQMADGHFAVFDKVTGIPAAGFPRADTAIWSGFGPECEQTNLGQPAAIYDQIAHRYVISQYAYTDVLKGPYYQCVAVSVSDDPAGAYYRYAFQMDAFNDFGVIALWPDEYHITFNMYGRTSPGPRACALQRDKMLTGDSAEMECHQFTSDETGVLLPAKLVGNTLPPTGTPEYLMSINSSNTITLFKFYVDFVTPTNARMSSAINIPVSQYAKACSATSGEGCAIQPGTANTLNILSDRLMRSLVYRQFSDHGSLVANHSVEGPPPKYAPAIRWYEFRFNTAVADPNPVIFQQSTLAPDSKNRFMGAISIDKFGNIALGYSVSSSLIYPSPELAARNYFDPSAALTIQALYTAHGSQVDGRQEWGRFSSMTIDPVDDCTFWYSNEYLKESGSLNWSSVILNFKLASCP